MSALPPPARLGAPERNVARAVLLLVLALYTATFSGLPGNVDGEVTFQTTSALVREGTLALGGTPEAEALIEHARGGPPGSFSVREGAGPGAGRYYGWFGIGQSIVAAPFYAAGRILSRLAPATEAAHGRHARHGVPRSEYFAHLLVGWRNPLLGALTAMLVALSLSRLGLDRRVAFLAGIGYGLCTFAWPQARDGLGDVQATFFLALAAYSLLVLRGSTAVRPALVFGVAQSFTVLTRAVLLPAVLVLDVAAALLWLRGAGGPSREPRAMRRAAAASVVLPQLLAVALWLGANQVRFGDWLDSGYGPALAGGLFGGDPFRAAAGLLFSPGKGLLWMAPGLLLLHLGVARARRSGSGAVFRTVALLFVAVFVPVVLLRGWHGAWTYGPRYLLPALPALWTLAAFGFSRSSIESRPRPAVLLLLGAGLLTTLPGVLVDTMTYHELAVEAASRTFEVPGDLGEADREAERFDRIHFDWGFAAPWAHWRILRHRVAGGEERFEGAEVFRGSSPGPPLAPAQHRERSWHHLAWQDLAGRLDARIWPALSLVLLLLAAGIVSAVRGLDF